jgi:hypothetical protein
MSIHLQMVHEHHDLYHLERVQLQQLGPCRVRLADDRRYQLFDARRTISDPTVNDE